MIGTRETIVEERATDKLLQREAGMMKLERIIAEREPTTLAELTVPAKELLDRYERLYTGAVNDVLREFALLDVALPSSLRPLRPERTVAGFAFTVKSVPCTRLTGEMTYRTEMLNHMHEDAFVLWDGSSDERATMWGGVMTATAHGRGVRAAAIDGGIRDTHQILERNFPVFFRYQSSNGSLGRAMITHYQIPLRFGDVFVCPGDVVVGDIDGVVVVPRRLAVEVLLRAEEMREDEKRIFGWVAEGQTIDEITEKGGYF